MNIVLADRINELSEHKTRFERVKKFSSNWKMVIAVSVTALTLKVAAEQLAMILLRHSV